MIRTKRGQANKEQRLIRSRRSEWCIRAILLGHRWLLFLARLLLKCQMLILTFTGLGMQNIYYKTSKDTRIHKL